MTLCGGFKRRNGFAGLRVIYTYDPIQNILYTYIYMINSICISLHLCIMFVRFLFVCIL